MPNMLTAWTVLKDLSWAINEHFQIWDCQKSGPGLLIVPNKLSMYIYIYLSYICIIHLFYIHESSIYLHIYIYSFLFLYRLYFAYKDMLFHWQANKSGMFLHLKAWAPAPSTQKSAGSHGATTSWTHATGASGIQGDDWWIKGRNLMDVREVDVEVS